ncbi:hypothetical protein ARTHRO8AJ_190002 [Arthrobacter sp. 8AJ]|nr:hypothetical protein ARTHRO8AJ_190002 [Arthrobacter sp. 8AJ]
MALAGNPAPEAPWPASPDASRDAGVEVPAAGEAVADESAGSSAVAGAAGSAAFPNPAAVGMPVVPAAAADAAALPPSRAPSARGRSVVAPADDPPGALADLLRLTSHQMMTATTAMRMIQKTMSMAGPSLRVAGVLSPTLRRVTTAVQRCRGTPDRPAENTGRSAAVERNVVRVSQYEIPILWLVRDLSGFSPDPATGGRSGSIRALDFPL